MVNKMLLILMIFIIIFYSKQRHFLIYILIYSFILENLLFVKRPISLMRSFKSQVTSKFCEHN